MNDIDKLPTKCRDCPYWELAREPYVCCDCTTPAKKCGGDYILRSDAKKAITDQWWTEIDGVPAADVEPKRKWISVNRDKPKEDGKYFVLRHIRGRPIVEIMYYGIPEYLKDRYFYYYDSEWGDIVVGDVTHWLPLSALPELPKGEQNG